MILAVFDIDGTLVDTGQVDNECYLQALEKAFGIAMTNPNWETFPDVTDSGIFRDIFSSRFNRPPNAGETILFIQTFVALLKEAFSVSPDRFKEIPGARALLDELSRSSNFTVALATGGWGASAEFKLKCANININDYPFATANDAYARADIVTAAVQRARRRLKVHGFSRVVLIGDGSWDIHTARDLGHPFIGVGPEAMFKSEGVVHSVLDYLDQDGFKTLLHIASPPG